MAKVIKSISIDYEIAQHIEQNRIGLSKIVNDFLKNYVVQSASIEELQDIDIELDNLDADIKTLTAKRVHLMQSQRDARAKQFEKQKLIETETEFKADALKELL